MLGLSRKLLTRACQGSSLFNWRTSAFGARLFSSTESNPTESSEPKFKAIDTEDLDAADVNTKLRRSLLYVPGSDQRKIDKVSDYFFEMGDCRLIFYHYFRLYQLPTQWIQLCSIAKTA